MSRAGQRPSALIRLFERGNTSEVMNMPKRKAVRKSDNFWQLDGESELYALSIPD
jgi:hypothetical protein